MVTRNVPVVQEPLWPNRADSAVRLFKRQWQIMSKDLEDDRFRGVTVREAVKGTVWARNTQLTVSGYSPLEIATGRRPPDLLDVETSDPAQLSVDSLAEDRTQQELQRLALTGELQTKTLSPGLLGPSDGIVRLAMSCLSSAAGLAS